MAPESSIKTVHQSLAEPSMLDQLKQQIVTSGNIMKNAQWVANHRACAFVPPSSTKTLNPFCTRMNAVAELRRQPMHQSMACLAAAASAQYLLAAIGKQQAEIATQ